MPMPLVLRIALRDLRRDARGLLILLAGIALGVAAIAAVGGAAGALSADLRGTARVAVGADVSLRLFHQPPDAAQRAYLAASGAYSEMVRLRARVSGPGMGAAALAEIEGVDGAWPLYGTIALDPPLGLEQALAPRGGVPGAVAESALFEALGARPGDRVRLAEREVELRAVLLPDAESRAAPVSLGPRLVVARKALEGTSLLAPGAPVFWYALARLPPGTDSRAWIAALEERFPDAGWRIVDAAEGVPGLERAVEIGRGLLLLVAVGIVLIGGAGVASAVRAHLGRRVRTIAILKSLGATDRLVVSIYFVQVAVVAGAAVLIGLVAGGAAPPLLARFWPAAPALAGIAPQPAALALAAAFGLLAAAIFAAWSLGRIHGVPVQPLFRDAVAPVRPGRRAALRRLAPVAAGGAALAALLHAAVPMPLLTGLFVAAASLSLLFFLLLGRALAWAAGRLARLCGPFSRLALANLARPGAATVPVVAALGLCLTLVVAIRTVEVNAVAWLQEAVPRDAPALAVLNLPPQAGEDLHARLIEMPGVERVARMPFLHARIARIGGTQLRQAAVPRDVAWAVRGDRGISWSDTPPGDGPIVAGAWWDRDHAGPPLASLDALVARRLGIGPGDTLTLDIQGEALTVTVANLRRIDWARLQLDFPIVLSPPAVPPRHRELMAIWAGEPALPEIEALLAEAAPGAAPIRIRPVLAQLAGALGTVAGAFSLLSAVAAGAALAVLAGSLAASYRARLRDMAILRMVGARPRQLALAGMLELVLLGAATAVPAAVLGTLAAWAVTLQVAPEAWTFRPALAPALALASIALMALAGLMLPRRALAASPAAFLRSEA